MKLLKLSATALILAGANILLSQSALACSPDLPNYGNCIRQQQDAIRQQEQQRYHDDYYYYGNNGGGNNRYYRVPYLAVLWTKKGEPYFFKTSYTMPMDIDFDIERANENSINQCNKSANRRPCKFSVSAIDNACIALAKSPYYYYAAGGNNCNEAKQSVMQICQIDDDNPSSCKFYKNRKPIEIFMKFNQ